jgi:phenylalanyl-tRNA synthetase beta chain
MSLLSEKEGYEFLRKPIDYNECVTIANPKTIEFEMVRTSLIPGLLKTIQSNITEAVNQFYHY